MAQIREIALADWNEFKVSFAGHLFDEAPFQKGKFIFRGHGNADWPLWPSATRRMPDLPRTDEGMRIGIEMKDEFVKELRRLQISPDLFLNEKTALALAQHHGMPTQLLDWSESPYVAAFFAFSDRILRQVKTDVAIWALDTDNPAWKTPFAEIISVDAPGNLRLRNQAGRFTLLRDARYDTLENYVTSFEDEGAPLVKFVMPSPNAEHVLADLDGMGINHCTLFPDVEGAARAAIFRISLKHGITVQ